MSPLHTALTDLRISTRRLLREPLFAGSAILIMGLGIGANTAMFSLVNTLLFQPPPYERPEDLVRIYATEPEADRPVGVSIAEFEAIRGHQDLFSSAVFNGDVEIVSLVHDQAPAETVMAEYLSSGYLSFLGLEPARGRDFSLEEGQPSASELVAIVSHSAWQRRFAGRSDVVGSEVRLNGFPVTVVGVGPPEFKGTVIGFESDFYLPWGTATAIDRRAAEAVDKREQRDFSMIARLRPGVTVEEARAALSVLASNLGAEYPGSNERWGMTVLPAADVRSHPLVDVVMVPISAFVMLVVGLVLLVACSNLANLLLARAAGRRREVAVRLALGAPRRRLVTQELTEAVLLSLAGALLGLVFAFALIRVLVTYQPPLPVSLSLDFTLDMRVLLFAAGLAVLTGIFFGLAPALRVSRPDLVSSLKSGAGAVLMGSRGVSPRRLLVTAQVAVSTLLLVGAGLFLRSLASSQRIDPGFESTRVAIANLDLGLAGYDDEAESRDLLERYRGRIAALPDVERVAVASRIPLGLLGSQAEEVALFSEERSEGRSGRRIDLAAVSADYFSVLNIRIVDGRAFTESDVETTSAVAIVSEDLAERLWGSARAVGERILVGGRPAEVVGVARNTKVKRLTEATSPLIYLPFQQRYEQTMFLVARTTTAPGAMPEHFRRELASLDPDIPLFEARAMDEQLGLTLYPARMAAAILSGFGLLALALAALGLYGVIAFSVAQRTREVGIRVALGATGSQLVGMVVREGVAMAGLGIAIGSILAVVGARPLRSLLAGVSAADPITFVGVALVLLLAAGAASYLPARRASKLDPLAALRAE